MDKRTVRRVVRELLELKESKAAYALAKKYCTGDRRFLDRIAREFLDRGDRDIRVFKHDSYFPAWAYIILGASRRVAERLQSAFVANGFFRQAESLARDCLKRRLTEEEVRTLITYYCNDMSGSCKGDEDELRVLARDTGGYPLEQWANEQVADFQRRFDDMID